jgi:hypothetical protein
MSDFSYLNDRIATQQIQERVTAAERSRSLTRRRPHRRHALATRLHSLAERIDG